MRFQQQDKYLIERAHSLNEIAKEKPYIFMGQVRSILLSVDTEKL